MAKFVAEGKLLKWGNSYGVRVSKADVERAGLHVGDPMTVTPGPPTKVDVSHLPVFRLGGTVTRLERRRVSYQRQLDKLVRSGQLTKAKAKRDMTDWLERQGDDDVGR